MRFHCDRLRSLTAGLLAVALIVTPARADESFGAITNVELTSQNQKVTFITRAGETLELEIQGSTEIVNGKGEKATLNAVAQAITKSKADGKKGVFARVTHAKKVVSKISVGLPKKKTAK